MDNFIPDGKCPKTGNLGSKKWTLLGSVRTLPPPAYVMIPSYPPLKMTSKLKSINLKRRTISRTQNRRTWSNLLSNLVWRCIRTFKDLKWKRSNISTTKSRELSVTSQICKKEFLKIQILIQAKLIDLVLYYLMSNNNYFNI